MQCVTHGARIKIAMNRVALHFPYVNTRKNTSIRLLETEKCAVENIATRANVKPSVIIQRAIRKFIEDYNTIGPVVLLEDFNSSMVKSAVTQAERAADADLSARLQSKSKRRRNGA